MKTDPLMTVGDVATLLNVPVGRVYDRWKPWGLPALKIGTQLRFRRADVDRWLSEQTA